MYVCVYTVFPDFVAFNGPFQKSESLDVDNSSLYNVEAFCTKYISLFPHIYKNGAIEIDEQRHRICLIRLYKCRRVWMHAL